MHLRSLLCVIMKIPSSSCGVWSCRNFRRGCTGVLWCCRAGGNIGDSLLHEWQVEVLKQERVLQGRNVVYCAPTSGGKSLVAEIIALHRICSTGKAAMLVLPFVTLCDEKAQHWERLLDSLHLKVRPPPVPCLPIHPALQCLKIHRMLRHHCDFTPAFGPHGAPFKVRISHIAGSTSNLLEEPGEGTCASAQVCMQVLRQYSGLGRTTAKIPDHTGIIVCTIEKANALVNFMTAEGTLAHSISTVIVDELHMVEDEDRGYLLELLLTKLRFVLPPADPETPAEACGGPAAARTQGLVSQFLGSAQATQAAGAHGMQLIGMSATLPNVELIGSWLNAVVYRTNFRPVWASSCARSF